MDQVPSFDQSRSKEKSIRGDLQEKGYYFPKLAEDWKNVSGMRLFYEDPEANPLDTPTGKIEFWSQALADNFPDDKERTPMARWIIPADLAEEGWTHDETLWASAARSTRCS